ncbi:MAG: 2'-5' RNA ligase family protein [Candidatus Colwellbacteria bacterium]|nr:2'-5' RNA ligase family protein [Candidatus Colwellbacteria bacterium]
MLTPPKDSTIINVCVIPSDEVGAECVKISQSLRSNGTAFILDGKSKFAHMTVFMARFANSKIPNILNATEKALKNTRSFLCEHTGYFMTSGRYLEVSYRRSEQFMALHEGLINSLKNYRINPGQPFEEGYFTPYTKEQRKNAEETGYDLAYNLYRPHITLTRYKEGQVPEVFPAFPQVKLSFNLNRVCVYKADDNGAVYERLAEFVI